MGDRQVDESSDQRLRAFADYLGISPKEAAKRLGAMYLPIIMSNAANEKLQFAKNSERKAIQSQKVMIATVAYFHYIVLLEQVYLSEAFKSFWFDWDKLTYSRRKDIVRVALEWTVGVLNPSLDNPDFSLLSDLSENKIDLFSVVDPTRYISETLADFMTRRKSSGSALLSYYLSRVLVQHLFSDLVLQTREQLIADVEAKVGS